jgi:hypothetical protein
MPTERREALFEVPNLDAISTEPRDYEELEIVFSILSSYCDFKKIAMEQRAAGNVNGAIELEKRLEEFYDQLPIWAKW